MTTTLVTGSSGFIGYHVSKALLARGETVVGLDNENDYYEVSLKEARRSDLEKDPKFTFHKANLENLAEVKAVFDAHKFDRVLNLAAQAGVRYSLVNPFAYVQTNIVGFHNLLELSKQAKVGNFVYASSASVYGNNKKMPFSVGDKTDEPISLYGASKMADELIAHSYSHFFGIPTIGLRFFNVYGPWGRPDGAFFIFAKAILDGKKLDVFNYGKTVRNFTYVDDVVRGVLAALDHSTRFDVFNLGNARTVDLLTMISLLEKVCGKKAELNLLPPVPADIPESGVDIAHTREKLGWEPSVPIEEGVARLASWYRSYYSI